MRKVPTTLLKVGGPWSVCTTEVATQFSLAGEQRYDEMVEATR